MISSNSSESSDVCMDSLEKDMEKDMEWEPDGVNLFDYSIQGDSVKTSLQ